MMFFADKREISCSKDFPPKMTPTRIFSFFIFLSLNKKLDFILESPFPQQLMHTLHICNTFFESRLEQTNPLSLEEAFGQHPVFLQLQYLPFLYADSGDGVLVTVAPPENFLSSKKDLPTFHLVQERSFPQYQKIDAWGHSKEILEWAKKKHLPYAIPDWDVVKIVNSKAFSFELCPLEDGALIFDETDLKRWLQLQKGPAVLKTCFGFSGRGHLRIHQGDDVAKALAFIAKERAKQLPIIAEPWLERILDFSTQWEIFSSGEIKKIGETICENDPKGGYLSNQVGGKEDLFGDYIDFLYEHERVVSPILQLIKSLGYFGNVGIDAFIYRKDNQ
jgi:hypothetical protein